MRVMTVFCQRCFVVKKYLDQLFHFYLLTLFKAFFEAKNLFTLNPAMDTEDLQLFRQKWKDELKEKTATKTEKRSPGDRDSLGKYQHSAEKRTFWEFRSIGEEVTQLKNADLADPLELLNQKSGKFGTSYQIPEDKSISNDKESETVLFSLPLPTVENVRSTFFPESKLSSGQTNCIENRTKSLVDQLIEDIDEITSIPFFDLSLPREVGIQIFSHLDFKDLCACAQVSKSWKILAEDELLWYHIGCQLGYVQRRDCTVVDQENWKAIVQHSMLEERNLRRNWKERICRVSGLEFERGGSLCAVSIHQNLVCSGYSNGTVVVWETRDRDNIFSYRELMTPDSQGTKPQVTSTAVHSRLCAAGFNNGDVYTWHSSLSSLPLCHCRCEGSVKSVSLTSDPPAFLAISDHELKVQMSDSNGQWICIESKNFEDKIGHAMFIPGSHSDSSMEHVAMATQDTVSVLAPGKGLLLALDQVIGGKLSCMDCTADHLALGVGSFGYGTLGNKVYLYNLETSKMLSILGGHYREITCLDLASCPQHRLVTGSYDCRVRVFDLRSEKVALSFHLGHKRSVSAVQMDDWKVVSGAEDGTLMVWDQRMTSTLWMTHARHPVRLCKFEGSRMFTANIPLDKTPRENLWYADDLILHRRHRGIIRLFDFSAKNSTEGIPEICSSSYDDTTGYNYNIKLSVPYDRIDGL